QRRGHFLGTRGIVLIVLFAICGWAIFEIIRYQGSGSVVAIIGCIATVGACAFALLVILVRVEQIDTFFEICDAFFSRLFLNIWNGFQWFFENKVVRACSFTLNIGVAFYLIFLLVY